MTVFQLGGPDFLNLLGYLLQVFCIHYLAGLASWRMA
jgi:hypothetical protein